MVCSIGMIVIILAYSTNLFYHVYQYNNGLNNFLECAFITFTVTTYHSFIILV